MYLANGLLEEILIELDVLTSLFNTNITALFER